MIPWLLVAGLMAERGEPLSELVAERKAAFPCSGEINRTIDNPEELLTLAEVTYSDRALAVDHVDGLSMSFPNWRFNLRKSNTEPVVRLNVESCADQALMEKKTAELLALIDG
jgi:phosphomannomutase